MFNSLGNVIAPALAGILLATTGIYGSIGLTLGSLTIAGVIIIILFTRDPAKNPGENKL